MEQIIVYLTVGFYSDICIERLTETTKDMSGHQHPEMKTECSECCATNNLLLFVSCRVRPVMIQGRVKRYYVGPLLGILLEEVGVKNVSAPCIILPPSLFGQLSLNP